MKKKMLNCTYTYIINSKIDINPANLKIAIREERREENIRRKKKTRIKIKPQKSIVLPLDLSRNNIVEYESIWILNCLLHYVLKRNNNLD